MADPKVKDEASADDDVAMEDIAEPTPAADQVATASPSQGGDDREPQVAPEGEEEGKKPETLQQPAPDKPKEGVKLEDLFDDMDSDEEFPSSHPAAPKASNRSNDSSQYGSSPPPEQELFGGGAGDVTDMKASEPALMRTFYQRIFPWRDLFMWLNHSPKPSKDFSHREFAFTLQNDAYLRYQSFLTHDLLRKDILRLMPSRFEIGPVYTLMPRDRKSHKSGFKPSAKELCFDIDLTDYDDIRTCCSKASICLKCWSFMTMAVRVLDAALREDFGFRHVLWVYSGRRGAHAWVCDPSARSMDDAKRRAIAGYLEVVKGGAQTGKKVNLRRPLHPHLSRSLELRKTHFQEDVLAVQNPWQSAEQAEKLLRLLPDPTLNDSLRRKWDAAPGRSSVAKWNDIDGVAKTGASKKLDTRTLLEAKQDVVLEYTYPRLDIEVSKKLNHLLKSPFVVHPGTGRVCVPIDTRDLDNFDPLQVPTVQGLIKEIDEWKKKDNGEEEYEEKDGNRGKPIQDWEKTSLKPYIDYFHSFVVALMRDERSKDVKVKRERDEQVAPGSDAMEF